MSELTAENEAQKYYPLLFDEQPTVEFLQKSTHILHIFRFQLINF